MTAFLRLLRMYAREGYEVRTGLNPYHFRGYRDAPFTAFFKDGRIVPSGGGISVQEIYFLESLFSAYHPERVLVVGNALGWSTLALALLNPGARVVALDPEAELGTELTNRIAAAEGLRATVVRARSPDDVAGVVATHLGGPVDLALIDGLHTNEQQERDFDAISACAAPSCVYLLHDVVNWKMTESFERIAARSGLRARILLRTSSGMGVLSPAGLDPVIDECLDAFCEKHPPVSPLRQGLRTARTLLRRYVGA